MHKMDSMVEARQCELASSTDIFKSIEQFNPIIVNKDQKVLCNSSGARKKTESDIFSSTVSPSDWQRLFTAISNLSDTTSKLRNTVCVMTEKIGRLTKLIVNLHCSEIVDLKT